MDGWEKSSVEEVLADRLHVEVHQGGGQAGGAEQGARLIFSLNLQLSQHCQEVSFFLIKPKNNLFEQNIYLVKGP